MKKADVIKSILGDRYGKPPAHTSGKAFSPTNIALVKYWGKRNSELNLPVTSSLSISLANKGAETLIEASSEAQDTILLNAQPVESSAPFARRLIEFLNLFRANQKINFNITIQANIPVAAGLASSACGFAALVQALNKLYRWNLTPTELSILARLGSGSACRSIWDGFVEWQMGLRDDGMDSHGALINETWHEFCIGLLIMQDKEKTVSSREAMQRTVMTSSLYSGWSAKVQQDLLLVKSAIHSKDFDLLGKTAESNAMTMHALMLSAWPPITYALPETLTAMQTIWKLRQQGLALYFTQDAGPNLKLLFLTKDLTSVQEQFPSIEIIKPFIRSVHVS